MDIPSTSPLNCSSSSFSILLYLPLQSFSHSLHTRGVFTMKLMKFKLQGPSLAWTPSKALAGALAMC